MRFTPMILLLACALAMPVRADPPAPADAATTDAAAAPAEPPTGIAQVRAAYAFARPVYDMMRARYRQIEATAALGGLPVNHLYAETKLADAASRTATMPSNDTLSASAWLDLASGPVVLDAPALPGRYHSVALLDLFADPAAVVGTRSGGRGGRYLIAGPGWNGTPPPQTTLLRSPTNDAWLIVRVRVGGPDDLAAATGLIRGFTLDTPADTLKPVATTAVPVETPDAATFIAVVDEALARTPLPAATLARPELAALGIAGGRIDPASVPAETMALWTATLPTLRAAARPPAGTTVDGWRYPDADGSGDGRGLGSLPRTEATELTAVADAAGAPLSGAKAYTVHLPANLPVGGFWSLTMYQRAPDGRLVFVDTPTKRYAVDDRTPELRAERDGGYDIFVQPRPPSGERVVNWLPAPRGTFTLVFRAYLPGPALLDGSFRLPPVTATDVIP